MNIQPQMRLAAWVGLILAAVSAWGQTTFNVAHANVAAGSAVGLSVRETSTGFLVFGRQTQLDSTGLDCSVSSFNESGGYIGEHFLNHSQYNGLGGADPIGNIPNGGYIGAQSTSTDETYGDTVFATRFNVEGDTLWTRQILSDTSVFVVKSASKAGHFYFTGSESYGTPVGMRGFVIRTDTMANLEMTHVSTTLNFPKTMDVDQQGNIYLGGTNEVIGPDKGYLLKLDSMGNELWHAYQQKPGGVWLGVKHVFGDKLLCMGGWYTPVLPPSGGPYDNTMYLSMYSDAGGFLWEYNGLKGDPDDDGIAYFTDGYQDSDSTFIVCGAIHRSFWNRAVIYRFTENGDSLWRRDYAHFGILDDLAHEIPWDIEPTSDGGMVLTGETWNEDTISPYDHQNMWLLKLDNMGCLVPGCQYVGINEIAYGLEHALKAWPNPGSGPINLSMDLPEGLPLEGKLLLQVFDARGRLVVRRELGGDLVQTIHLDLTGQPAGVYSAHISDDHRILTGAKIIVQ